jgi:YHS domain-containing protein
MSLKSVAAAAIISLATIAAGPALAFDPSSPASVNVEAPSIGLKSHDPVAYFTDGKPLEGDPAIAAEHAGVTYYFATPANREAFVADPEHYAPQYGGFCALAMSFGKKVDIDPNAWKIVEDRLYVQANPRAAEVWEKDVSGNISKADGNWPAVMDKAPNAL